MCSEVAVVPPFYEGLVVGKLVTYLPVQLGNVVVYVSFPAPERNVGKQLVVCRESVGLR